MNLNKTMFIDKENLIVKTKNSRGYIFNKINKKYIFLNEEIINYILEGTNRDITFLEFINAFDDDDKEYIKEMLEILDTMDLFENKNISEKRLKCIHMELTHKCNLECKHCFLKASPYKKTNLFLEDWKNVIDKIAYLNPEQFVFTGGEPLLFDYFEELVLYAQKKLPNTSFTLSTNGTLINKYDINLFKNYFDAIYISLDGYDRESSDKIRGKGVFDKVINNIKLLKEKGFNNIDLSFTQGDYNLENRNKFKKLCDDLELTCTIRTFTPRGRGKENLNLFSTEEKEVPISILQSVERCAKACEEGEEVTTSCAACNAGEGQIIIDDEANAYPCASLRSDDFIISNMLDKDCISKIMEFKGGYNLYESIIYKNEDCKNCDLNIFCWNCPSNFEQVYNSDKLEYWCDNIKTNLDKIIWEEV